MSKITMAAAAAAGYVLGARAGRDRYDELSQKAEELWNNPKVQKGTRRAKAAVEDTTSDGESQVDGTSMSQQDHGDSTDQPGGSYV